jgi:hypothetical protein
LQSCCFLPFSFFPAFSSFLKSPQVTFCLTLRVPAGQRTFFSYPDSKPVTTSVPTSLRASLRLASRFSLSIRPLGSAQPGPLSLSPVSTAFLATVRFDASFCFHPLTVSISAEKLSGLARPNATHQPLPGRACFEKTKQKGERIREGRPGSRRKQNTWTSPWP